MEITSQNTTIPAQRVNESEGQLSSQKLNSPVPTEAKNQASSSQKNKEILPDEAIKGLEQTLDKVNKVFESTSTAIRFEINRDVDRVVIKIVNPQTDEMIRQIPSEEALKISKNLTQYLEKIQANSEQMAQNTPEPGLILDNNV